MILAPIMHIIAQAMRGRSVVRPILGDFYLNLSNPVNCTISDAQGVGTLVSQADFYLNLSNPINCTISDAQAVGTITGGGSGSLITPSLVLNRSSGVAPLGVHFDATGTVAPAITARPLHDLRYYVNFGDGSAGNLTYGLKAGTTRNAAIGFVAAHTYRTPGTYTATLTVEAYVGAAWDTVSITSETITVADPDVQWAGTKTICISTDGDFTGAPSGHVPVTSSNHATAIAANIGSGDKRILFKRGQTFTATSDISMNQNGPGLVGAFGSGADPILSSSTSNIFNFGSGANPSYGDWRVQDIVADCLGNLSTAAYYAGATMNYLTFVGCESRNAHFGWLSSGSNLVGWNTPTFTNGLWDSWVIDECFANGSTGAYPGPGDGGNGMYIAGYRFGVINSKIDPNYLGEHGIRMGHCIKTAVSNLDVERVVNTKAFISLRSGDQDSVNHPAGTPGVYGTSPPILYSEKNFVTYNKMISVTSGQTVALGCGATNAISTGRARDFVFDSNWGDGDVVEFSCQGQDATFRNNFIVVRGGGNAIFGTPALDIVPPLFQTTRVNFYNNSVYVFGNGATYGNTVLFGPSGTAMPDAVAEVRNNIVYGPQALGAYLIFAGIVGQGGAGGLTQSNNTVEAQLQTNPYVATVRPTSPADFALSIGSYARNSGISIAGAWADYNGTRFDPSGRDMGALQHI